MARRSFEGRWDLGGRDLTSLLRESKRYRGESLWNDAWRRLRRNRAAWWSMVFLAAFGLLSFLAPVLPLPSPVSLDLSAGDALPPRWPWEPTHLARDWDPALDEGRGTHDADVAPGVLPSRAVGSLFDDGWRHQAILQFRTETPSGEIDALLALVREASGRAPRSETRPSELEGRWDQFLMVPLLAGDRPRVDWVPTGVEGELFVHRHGEDLVYDVTLPREVGRVGRWSVEQRTRRGEIFLSLADDGADVADRSGAAPQAGYQLAFRLAEMPDGEPSVLVLNGRAYDAEGAPLAEPPAGTGSDAGTARATELAGHVHPDLGRRIEAALRAEPVPGATYAGMRIEDGYGWDLSRVDEWMLSARAALFGSWQTGSWMGTDENGRDVLARIVWGSRTSILVALAAAACSLIIGVVYGAFSGLVGGRVDNLMMRIVDILYSVPFIFVVIFLITLINEYRTELEDVYGIDREKVFFVVIGAIYWLTMARVVRGQVLSLKNTEFIEAARVTGASTLRILFAHLVPNVLSIVIVYLTLTIPAVMLFEAFLSFLGLGIEPPKVSWGLLAVDGTKAINPIRIYWWLVVFPALAMGATLLSLNVLGDGLRDALDPKLRGKD